MDRKQWRGLIMLNGALLLVLALVTAMPSATAQQDANRPRGDYTMIGARAQGISESVIWIFDVANQEAIALRYDQSSRALQPIGHRNLAADANQARGGRGGR